jgi:uncharacterized protein YndB with AHSA1/START domain
VDRRISPINLSATVSRAPEEAFRIFTEEFGQWWPIHEYSIGRDRTEKAVFEPREGGRVYEVMEGGREATWGRVTRWDPPHRLELEWQTRPEAPGPTSLTVTFSPEGAAARVDVDHRGWDIYGEKASLAREEYEIGWHTTLPLFAAQANRAGQSVTSPGDPPAPGRG